MSPFLTVTVATGRGFLTFTNPTQASKFVELLTSTGQNAVITWRHGDRIEERAVVHGVAHSDLAIQRLEIETVMDPDSQSALVPDLQVASDGRPAVARPHLFGMRCIVLVGGDS